MISICLTKFIEEAKDPWSQVIMKGFLKALNKNKKLYEVEEIFGYPQKKYGNASRKLFNRLYI